MATPKSPAPIVAVLILALVLLLSVLAPNSVFSITGSTGEFARAGTCPVEITTWGVGGGSDFTCADAKQAGADEGVKECQKRARSLCPVNCRAMQSDSFQIVSQEITTCSTMTDPSLGVDRFISGSGTICKITCVRSRDR